MCSTKCVVLSEGFDLMHSVSKEGLCMFSATLVKIDTEQCGDGFQRALLLF